MTAETEFELVVITSAEGHTRTVGTFQTEAEALKRAEQHKHSDWAIYKINYLRDGTRKSSLEIVSK